jgi:hypothetical protein
LEKQEYDQGDGCEVHGCENQASWIVPIRGAIVGDAAMGVSLYNEKRFCSTCVEKFLKSEEVDKLGRLPLNLARGNS